MRRAAGFTIIEVLIVVAVLTAATATFVAVAEAIHARDRETAAYAEDLAGLRRAVRTVQADLREARSLQDLHYRHEDSTLIRNGQVLARNIQMFTVRQEGTLAHVYVELAPRSDAPTRRTAALRFAVHLRNLKRGGAR